MKRVDRAMLTVFATAGLSVSAMGWSVPFLEWIYSDCDTAFHTDPCVGTFEAILVVMVGLFNLTLLPFGAWYFWRLTKS